MKRQILLLKCYYSYMTTVITTENQSKRWSDNIEYTEGLSPCYWWLDILRVHTVTPSIKGRFRFALNLCHTTNYDLSHWLCSWGLDLPVIPRAFPFGHLQSQLFTRRGYEYKDDSSTIFNKYQVTKISKEQFSEADILDTSLQRNSKRYLSKITDYDLCMIYPY